MAKTDYIRTSDADFAQQLLTFKTTIGGYAATVGVTPAQVTAQAADADYFNYVLASREIMQNGAQQWGGWRNLIRNGGKPPPAGAPVAPTFPAAVPAVAPGVEARFRALAQQIKASGNYNSAIGEALGIEGAQQTGPDLSELKPVIDAIVSGNQVNITWGWGGNSAFLDMIELQVDRNDGKGFVLLAYDTTPNYTDTMSFPSAPTKWRYQAIYRVNDDRVGQWSNPISVAIGG